MQFLRRSFRALRVAGIFAAAVAELVLRRPQTRRARAEWLTRLCRRVLRAAKVTYTVSGPIPEVGAVITNHLSYLDIIIHGALRPCVFVSAIETRRMPLIGWMSMMAGTVYVTRGAGGSAAKAAGGMTEGFRDGLPVVFFPEGGTSVGDQPLLPLHSGLLSIALEDGAPVTPGFLSYQLSEQDLAQGRSAREDVHWGTQTLPAHLWNFMGLHGVKGHVAFAEGPIAFTPRARSERKVAALEARDAILQLVGKKEPEQLQRK